MGYHLNRLDEPVFIALSKPLLTVFGIHLRLESCVVLLQSWSSALQAPSVPGIRVRISLDVEIHIFGPL